MLGRVADRLDARWSKRLRNPGDATTFAVSAASGDVSRGVRQGQKQDPGRGYSIGGPLASAIVGTSCAPGTRFAENMPSARIFLPARAASSSSARPPAPGFRHPATPGAPGRCLVRDMHHVDPGGLLQQLGSEVRRGADPARTENNLAGLRARVGDQFAHVRAGKLSLTVRIRGAMAASETGVKLFTGSNGSLPA